MSQGLYPAFDVLVVDDESSIIQGMMSILRSEGISNAHSLDDSGLVLDYLDTHDVGILLLDILMPGLTGEKLLPLVRLAHPEVSIAIVTAVRDVELAVQCMRAGASDFLIKPLQPERFVTTIRRIIENQELRRENIAVTERLLSPRVERNPAFSAIISVDPTMDSIMRYAEAIAPTSHPVLIIGETGTGKELFSRAIHALSGREGQFVAVNVAGLDDTFFSDTLFGHTAGAFTGASKALNGLVETAKDGTLFLDEIGDLSPSSQIKLLRVIETGEYYPLGSDSMKRSKARIIVATNRDLNAESAVGVFRKDLYYRLNSHHIEVPPLRQRMCDIPFLLEHFIHRFEEASGRTSVQIPTRLLPLLSTYSFPGNVRELESLTFDALNLGHPGKLHLAPFRAVIEKSAPGPATELLNMVFPRTLPTIKTVTSLLIGEALARSKGNQALASRLLGISPQAMSKRLLKKRSGPPTADKPKGPATRRGEGPGQGLEDKEGDQEGARSPMD